MGYSDIYVAGYDSSGNVLWAKSLGGQDNDLGTGIRSSPTGDVYVTGDFGSYSIAFANTTITNTGNYDIFLAKLSNDTTVSTQTIERFADTKIFPNPAQDKIHLKSEGFSKITIYDIASRKVLEQQFANATTLNVSGLANGLYVYELNKNGTMMRGKFIKE